MSFSSKSVLEIKHIYIAIYDYDARTDDDLTFRVGDSLKVLDKRLVIFED